MLPSRAGYLRNLGHSDRERARVLFLFFWGLLAIAAGFQILLHLLFSPSLLVDAAFGMVIAATGLGLWLLHSGKLDLAGGIVSTTVLAAVCLTAVTDLLSDSPVRAFTEIGLMVGSLILAALAGPRYLTLIFAAICSLALFLFLGVLARDPGWAGHAAVYAEFAVDGLVAVGTSALMLSLMRRIYRRSLQALSTRTRRQERFLESLRRSEERFHRLADASFEAILIERNGQILEMNRAFEELFGYTRDMGPPSLETLVISEDRRRLPLLLLSRNRQVIELRCQRKDGTPIIVEARSSVLRGSDSMVRSLVMRDVTAERDSRQLLEYQAYHDTLTGLANRRMLQLRADEYMRQGRTCALLLADLDRFKDINETLGHPFGDRILRRLGERLAQVYPDPALACRTGGDEFAILIPDLETESSVLRAAEEFRETIGRSISEAGLSLEIEASVGATVGPSHADNLNGLLRCADVAMYAAKHTRGTSALYSRVMDLDNPRRFQLVSDLGRMIRERLFDLHFQPRVRLSDGFIDGFEVLTRWRHPTLGAISPGELIPLAETGNLMGPLTLAVLEETLRQQKIWADSGFVPALAVNISARNLSDQDFPSQVLETLKRFGTIPRGLELEITESAFLHDPRRAMESAHRLSEAGFSLAIDDFGTGYSSLSYLSDLPVQTLKIDLSFVREMLEKHKNLVLVNSTIQLAHALGLSVIAEGVESDGTARELARMHCDFAQGFHFGAPQPASNILRDEYAN